MKLKEKKVTNLLDRISKTRDLLETGDIEKIFRNTFQLEKLKNDIIRQIKKYIEHEAHKLDFSSEDIKALSDEIFNIEKKLTPIKYKSIFKELSDKAPITMEHYNNLCYKVRDRLYFDKFIRPIANDLSFFALTQWLWSESDYKKDFMEQLTDHLKSFI